MHLAGLGCRLEFKLLQGALHGEFYVCTFIKVMGVCLFSPRLCVRARVCVCEKELGFKSWGRQCFGEPDGFKNFRWSVKLFSPCQEEDNPVLYHRPCCSLQDTEDAGGARIKENIVAGWDKGANCLAQSSKRVFPQKKQKRYIWGWKKNTLMLKFHH